MSWKPGAWGAWGLAVALAMAGCVSGAAAQRGRPLYPVAGTPRAANQVAQLTVSLPLGGAPGGGATSFIASVDGRDVSGLDPLFELLPGCHIVKTQSDFVMANENISFSGSLGTLLFPFRMTAGHEYVVVVELTGQDGATGRIAVYGTERDAKGAVVQKLGPARGEDELRACLAWRPPTP